jgi:hypothetical protein
MRRPGEKTQSLIMEQFRAEAPGPGASNVGFNEWAQSSELCAYFDSLQ